MALSIVGVLLVGLGALVALGSGVLWRREARRELFVDDWVEIGLAIVGVLGVVLAGIGALLVVIELAVG